MISDRLALFTTSLQSHSHSHSHAHESRASSQWSVTVSRHVSPKPGCLTCICSCSLSSSITDEAPPPPGCAIHSLLARAHKVVGRRPGAGGVRFAVRGRVREGARRYRYRWKQLGQKRSQLREEVPRDYLARCRTRSSRRKKNATVSHARRYRPRRAPQCHAVSRLELLQRDQLHIRSRVYGPRS